MMEHPQCGSSTLGDNYFKPKTVAKCHERIDGLLHTNKTQVETIWQLKNEIELSKAESSLRGAKLQIAQSNAESAQSNLSAIKSVLRLLGEEIKP